MKKNQKTYLLLGLVIAIWGILGFRIVKSISPSEPEPTTTITNIEFKPTALKERDTFSILANYRDPFLGTIPKSTNKPTSAKATVGKQIKPKMPEKNIIYSGLVNDNATGQKIFFLSVDGQQLMLSKNQEAEGVKIISGNAEKVKLRYNGLTKTIGREQ